MATVVEAVVPAAGAGAGAGAGFFRPLLAAASSLELTVKEIKLGSMSGHDRTLLDVLTRTMKDLPLSLSALSGSGSAGRQLSSSAQVAWKSRWQAFYLYSAKLLWVP